MLSRDHRYNRLNTAILQAIYYENEILSLSRFFKPDVQSIYDVLSVAENNVGDAGSGLELSQQSSTGGDRQLLSVSTIHSHALARGRYCLLYKGGYFIYLFSINPPLIQ